MLNGAIGRRLYAACQYWPTRHEERRQGARADLLLATSHYDRELFEQSLRLRRVAVVPNGIDLTEFTPQPQTHAPVILFSALMSYYPNQHGLRWFLDAVCRSFCSACPRRDSSPPARSAALVVGAPRAQCRGHRAGS
jgi:glycosyltransferase involved in cell wall biosynthesis